MHETALMESIVQTVKDICKEQEIKQIQKIGLKVGKLSNALPDALQFAYDAISTHEPMLLKCELEMQIEPVIAECVLCNERYEPENEYAKCPHCQMPSGKILSGEELEISFIEGE